MRNAHVEQPVRVLVRSFVRDEKPAKAPLISMSK
jgi:hypothetical protein